MSAAKVEAICCNWVIAVCVTCIVPVAWPMLFCQVCSAVNCGFSVSETAAPLPRPA